MAEEVADDLRQVRPHVPARILPADRRRVQTSRSRHARESAALWSLFAGRNALQVPRRLAYFALPASRLRRPHANPARALTLSFLPKVAASANFSHLRHASPTHVFSSR